ncbi:MAG: glycosyltransferase, partial [Patescibacteria group bacterium]|nr:glycosyltransferase [Patescibacteria group bacterium]
MRVLLVITQGVIGGATNSVYWLAKGLKEKKIEVVVGFGEGDYLKEKLKNEGIDYINFKYLRRTINPLRNILFIFEIKNLLDKKKFDVVHFNSSNSLLGAVGAKLSKSKPKTVFVFHGLSVLDPMYRKNLLFKPIYFLFFKLLLRFIDESIFVSIENLKIAKKIKLVKNGIVIYNGIPKPTFLPRDKVIKIFEQKLNINLKNKFIIGSIGRLDYQKNYEFLIKILPRVLKII